MTFDLATSRAFAHVLFDALSTVDEKDEEASMLTLALERANQIGAFEATFDEGEVRLDATNALTGALTALQTLLTMLHEQVGGDPLVLLAEVRERYDHDLADD